MSQSLLVASNSINNRDKKRRARGDIVPPTFMRDGKEIEDTGLQYLILFETDQYDVVGERDIHINVEDSETGVVLDKGTKYNVSILTRGNLKKSLNFFLN